MPLLPHARDMAARGAVPGGTQRNLTSIADAVSFAVGVDETTRVLLCDAQTSGGLLIAVPPDKTEALVTALARAEAPAAAVIGRVVAGPPGRVAVG